MEVAQYDCIELKIISRLFTRDLLTFHLTLPGATYESQLNNHHQIPDTVIQVEIGGKVYTFTLVVLK